VWRRRGDTLTYEDWFPLQPDAPRQAGIWLHCGFSYRWRDTPATTRTWGYICATDSRGPQLATTPFPKTATVPATTTTSVAPTTTPVASTLAPGSCPAPYENVVGGCYLFVNLFPDEISFYEAEAECQVRFCFMCVVMFILRFYTGVYRANWRVAI
jgi:hypothetical protein